MQRRNGNARSWTRRNRSLNPREERCMGTKGDPTLPSNGARNESRLFQVRPWDDAIPQLYVDPVRNPSHPSMKAKHLSGRFMHIRQWTPRAIPGIRNHPPTKRSKIVPHPTDIPSFPYTAQPQKPPQKTGTSPISPPPVQMYPFCVRCMWVEWGATESVRLNPEGDRSTFIVHFKSARSRRSVRHERVLAWRRTTSRTG